MKSKANSVFISNIYEQDVVDTNWNEYQVVVTSNNNPNLITLRASETTNTVLSVTSNYINLQQGSKIYLSNNGTTLVEGSIGSITSGTVKSNTSTKTSLVTGWNSSSTSNSYFAQTTSTSAAYGGTNFLKPDGTLLWIRNADGVIQEWRMTVPFNPSSAVSTGKSVATVGITGVSGGDQMGFCFSSDGRYLFRVVYQATLQSGTQTAVLRNTLTTPWDISTISNVCVQQRQINMADAAGTASAASQNRSMRISNDGKKIIIFHHSSGYAYTSTLTKPWDLTTYVSSSVSTSAMYTSGNYANWHVSEDGTTWYCWPIASTTVVNLNIGSFGTPWEASTMAFSKTIPLSGFGSQLGTVSTTYPPQGWISPDGKYTTILNSVNQGLGWATYNLETQGGDAAKSYNIDISGFGLAAAPNTAWMKLGNVYVAAAQTTPKLTMEKYQLDLDTDTPATTTSAVIGIDGTGELSVGDTVILNDTTTVTLTSVTETANGLAIKSPVDTTGYIRYYNKSLQTLVSSTDTTGSVRSNGSMRFSRNGNYLYIVGDSTAAYGQGIYQYYLPVAWDISTGVFVDFLYIGGYMNTNTTGYNTSFTYVSGFDIDPDGKSFFVLWGAINAQAKMYYYKLSKPHNFLSLISTNVYDVSGPTTGSNSYLHQYARFNRTGTQMLGVEFSTSTILSSWYNTFGTPYDLTTVTGAFTTAAQPGTPASAPGIDTCFTPEGNYILCLGLNGSQDGYISWQPVTSGNNNFGGTFNTKTSATANNIQFPAASGLTTATPLRSIDISPDGTKLYVMTRAGVIHQFAVRLKTLTKYVIGFAAQASAPTTVHLPAQATLQTLTPSLDSGNNTIVYTGTNNITNARSIQFKLQDGYGGNEVTQVRINLKKSQ